MSEEKEKDASAQGRPESPWISRRGMVAGCAGAAALLAVGGLRFTPHAPLLRPPGGQGDETVTFACVRCEKCVEVCPRKVITPTHAEDGLLNMRTPTMDFENGYCDFCIEENGGVPLCESVCPTEALQLPQGATQDSTVIGVAQIDTRTCLAYRNTGCKYCYDACVAFRGQEKAALSLQDGKYPVVDASVCIGCGACQSVCVSLKAGSIAEGATERAIVVRTAGEVA